MSEAKHPYPSLRPQVIHVRGTDFEMGFQHGEAVGESALKGMAKFIIEFWNSVYQLDQKRRGEKVLYQLVKTYAEKYLQPKLLRQVQQKNLDRLAGLSKSSGLDKEELILSYLIPDLSRVMEAHLCAIAPAVFLKARLPTFGCSSFISRGKSFLVGRNLDYPGVCYWDRYPVIQCTTPNKGLRYIGFTTAGTPLCGITGINEAQISVSLHQMYCSNSSLTGVLPYMIGEEILSRSRNLNEAFEVLSRYKLSSSWSFVVSSGQERNGFIQEASPRARGTRWVNERHSYLTHSNFFQTPQCKLNEYSASARMNWDNKARNDRLNSLIRGFGFDLQIDQAVKAISDHFDPYWSEEKITNRTVSQAFNVQSLVLDPYEMKVYFACGDAPVHLRQFEGFDLGAIFSGKDGRIGKTISGYQFTDPTLKVAKENFILAFVESMDGDLESSFSYACKSLKAHFSPEVAIPTALIAMKQGDLKCACELLERAKMEVEKKVTEVNFSFFPPEYFEICFYLARAYDLLSLRTNALSLYRFTAGHPNLEDNNIRRLSNLGGPYKRESLRKIVTPFSSYVPVQ